ncbi:MAG: hypothetical protein Q8S18_13605 [Bacteroidales bacterium]|nr:hypothetical protein [Bacteroidales bacterium]
MKANYYLVLLGFLLSSCSATKRDAKVISSDVFEDHLTTEFVFQQGAYYQFKFDDASMVNGIDELAVLNELVKQGVSWQDAWYKAPSRMCTPPGSEMGMMVIVEPAFVIRLAKKSEKMSQFGFGFTDSPSLGDCAFSVKRYIR